MRLGNYTTKLNKDSKVYKMYKKAYIVERHRHRYEVNNKYVSILEEKGLSFVGIDNKKKLMEVIELKNHRYYIGTQYHPEYISRNGKPHPLFVGLLDCWIDNYIGTFIYFF